MGIRDKISHHYFEIDTDVVFRTIEEDIPQMMPIVEKMISDLEYNRKNVKWKKWSRRSFHFTLLFLTFEEEMIIGQAINPKKRRN